MSVTRRNPSACSETAESELSGGSCESRRVLSELKITGRKRESDGLDVTQNQTELSGISPLVHYSLISSAITENCSPSRSPPLPPFLRLPEDLAQPKEGAAPPSRHCAEGRSRDTHGDLWRAGRRKMDAAGFPAGQPTGEVFTHEFN